MLVTPHPLLVETDWLAAHLEHRGLRVVDCRYYFDGHDAEALYRAGHIPGALHVNWEQELSDVEAQPPNLVPRPEQLRTTMRRLGVSDDTLVVGYDDEGGHFASRLWWVLRYYSRDQVRILNGGLVKWLAEGRPVTDGVPRVPPGTFEPGPPQRAQRATRADVLAALSDPLARIVDVRRRTEYTGEEVRAQRSGHVLGATHLFWRENLNDDWTFKTPLEVLRRHEAAGIAPSHRAITYCQGGVRAAHAAFALTYAGYPEVQMYDGSWAEWGNDATVPVEKDELSNGHPWIGPLGEPS